ncbi:MAG: adenylate/guanylate cyclase domain-containing protein [Marinobacterium sp.]|nr:adenylate/guanylate cyclase domain-containing protein [Marinobacterium sp.]
MQLHSITSLRLGLSVSALLLSFTLLLEDGLPRPLTQLELLAYDWRMTLFSPPQEIDTRIVIVDIDERSLEQEGQWPWPRTRLAELLNTLGQHYQTSIIGLDILFPEPARQPHQDQALKQALERNQTLLAELFQLETGTRSLQAAKLTNGLSIPSPQRIPHARGYIGNNTLLSTSAQAGHISIDVDEDGKVRRMPPVLSWNNQQYLSLPLAILQQLFHLPPPTLHSPDSWLAPNLELQSPPFKLPLNDQGRLLIPFQGRAGHYLYIPAIDVLKRQVEPALLQDRIILVGSSATGLYDLISTPWSKHYPGVEVHANILSALLDNHLFHQPANSSLLTGSLCLLLFSLIMFSYTQLNITLSTLIPALLACCWIILNIYNWQYHQLALPLTPPLLLILALVLINSPALALQATRQRQLLYRHFQDYVPRAVVEQLIKDTSHQGIQPERRDMTVLFMDIRGFTSIAERLSPGQLANLMNKVLSPVTRIIHEQGGTIDKYMGDAVMAFWGAPLQQPDHAQRAVDTALEILDILTELNQSLHHQGFPPIRVGIGINTGNMTVGNMGSDFRVSYTVIGDAVNIAARLESLTKEYQSDILIGSSTAEALNRRTPCRYLGPATIKGRKKTIHIYAPTSYQNTTDAKSASKPDHPPL